jgi:hypothetical protein
MKSTDLAFAEYLDWCCGRYAKSHSFRRKLEHERPASPDAATPAHSHSRRSA